MKGKASLLAAVAATTALAVDALINPQVLVVMAHEQNNGQFQYVEKRVPTRSTPEVVHALEWLAERGVDAGSVQLPRSDFYTFVQTRHIEIAVNEGNPPWVQPDKFHIVRTGKPCFKNTALRQLTLRSYTVPVKAQVISDGGQHTVWANCITQGGFYRWIVRIRHLLTPNG